MSTQWTFAKLPGEIFKQSAAANMLVGDATPTPTLLEISDWFTGNPRVRDLGWGIPVVKVLEPVPYAPALRVPPPPSVFNTPASSRQVGGTHYTQMKIQPFEFSMANNLDPMRHTIIKYITRKKDSVLEDLQKAKHTLELLIEWEQQNDQ